LSQTNENLGKGGGGDIRKEDLQTDYGWIDPGALISVYHGGMLGTGGGDAGENQQVVRGRKVLSETQICGGPFAEPREFEEEQQKAYIDTKKGRQGVEGEKVSNKTSRRCKNTGKPGQVKRKGHQPPGQKGQKANQKGYDN